MKLNKWHYTYDIHNFVKIGGEKFKLNTAYDNIMVLIKAMQDEYLENKVDAYMKLIFFKSDYNTVREKLKGWSYEDLIELINHINKKALFFENSSKGKKDFDLDLDADLIFASFYKDYGISLVEKKGKMKWIEFLILLENLSQDTSLMSAIKLVNTPDKELTPDGRRSKRDRVSMLRGGLDINDRLNALEQFLSNGAKNVSKKESSPKN